MCRHVHAEELGGDLLDLVRLVEDRDLVGRQHLRLGPGRAQRQVGEEQMVVDDHQLRLQRAPPHAGHEAALEEGAARPEPRLRRRRDLAPERRVVGQLGQVGAVTGGCPRHPGDDAVELGRGHERRLPRLLLEAPQAQVVAETLHHRPLERLRHDRLQPRQIDARDLVLKSLGAGADHHLAPRQQRRHQVRHGLAGAGAGLDEQAIVALDRLGDALGHRELAGARFVAGQRRRRPARAAPARGRWGRGGRRRSRR